MTWLARVASQHPLALPATLRASYGVSWWQAGTDSMPWPEALTLVSHALAQPSTFLGAEHAQWDYPASVPEIIGMLMSADTKEGVRAVTRLLPFDPDAERKAAERAEVEAATADLLAHVKFA